MVRRLLHLDPFSGLAGDMFLGAALDLGVDPAAIDAAIAALGIEGLGFVTTRSARGGLSGLRFEVRRHGEPLAGEESGPDGSAHGRDSDRDNDHGHSHGHGPGHGHSDSPPGADPWRPPAGRSHSEGSGPHQHPHSHHHESTRSWADIRRLIGEAMGLPAEVRERALQLFARLAEAEARAHGLASPDEVHFHEIGALDSIVDLVGAAAAIVELAPDHVSSSPANVGSGTVPTAHGVLPVPAPATAALLLGIPTYSEGAGELLTPTGAVLLAELVDEFAPAPPWTPRALGHGLGRREVAGRPNVFRMTLGEGGEAAPEVAVVECEIDDLAGEGFGWLLERLIAEGALDVYYTSVQMKKNRPGVLVTLLCRPPDLDRLAAVLLAESGSLGCRYSLRRRFEAERRSRTVSTAYGEIAVKEAWLDGRTVAVSPEFEACRRAAEEHSVPWRLVHQAALAAALG